MALIKLIFRKRKSLDEAIEQLELKKTTAVNIINKYNETGSFPMRKFKKSKSSLVRKENLYDSENNEDFFKINKEDIKLEQKDNSNNQNTSNDENFVLKE